MDEATAIDLEIKHVSLTTKNWKAYYEQISILFFVFVLFDPKFLRKIE